MLNKIIGKIAEGVEMETHVIVTSDHHINSTVSLCVPSMNLDDGDSHRASRPQRALWESWCDMWQEVGRLPGRKIAVLNGDLGELDTKRRTTQLVTHNKATIMALILETLTPMLEVVDKVIVIRGTMAHEGKSQWMEEAIAKDLDNTIPDTNTQSWYHCRAEIAGLKFDLAHHTGMGRLPWTEKNAANKLAVQVTYHYLNDLRQPVPDIAIRSHNHRYADSGGNFDTFAVCTRAWTLKTEYIYRIGGELSISDIGGHLFSIRDGAYSYDPNRFKYEPKVGRVWALKI